jgi:collagenase-like PrtC family protease
MTEPELSLAPVPYFWPRDTVFEFYREVRGWPVETVYLGETVCPKRRRLRPDDWLAIGEDLKAAGKRVVISTLVLLEAASELGALRQLCRRSPFPIEANDVAAVNVLSQLGRPFVAGATLNAYNPRTLTRLRAAGAERWVLPVELDRQAAAALAASAPDLTAEVLAWGRLPLAWSARCFTARAENRSRDQCGFVCGNDPDGRLVRSRDGKPFLNINGIHTESALTQCLAADYADLRASGIGALRIVPQATGTAAVVAGFHALRHGAHPQEISSRLEPLAAVATCNGYWHGEEGAARIAVGG